ncbi:MAG: hypothetical protein PHT12_05850 [Patescibacteria group bacterium]|nr:hypothetical protein [Patescibacteria group bacterium]
MERRGLKIEVGPGTRGKHSASPGTARKCAAFSIVEALISVAIFGVLAAGTIVVMFGPLAAGADTAERSRAVFLAEEGVEAARAIRNDSWNSLAVGAHGIRKNPRWEFFGANDQTTEGANVFTRVVTVEAVNRSGALCDGDIVTSGGCLDLRTRKVISTVSWNSAFGIPVKMVESTTYLANWNVYDWRQSTDTDWNAGTLTNTVADGTGESANLTLASAAKIWDPLGGAQGLVHTTNTDWNSGTYSGTQNVGSGTPASVTEAGISEWTNYAQPRTWTETRDTDFSDGTFSNTVVVDTGDLGAVSLNNVLDWYGRTSPTTSQLNDAYMFSSSDGWAVGNDGIIVRWNGTAWLLFADLGTQMFTGIDCVSATDCWAVADSGRIAHWDGTAWSQLFDLGAQTFRDVRMTSATEGWAVADGGVIYRWNGSTWSAETSGSTDNLNGIAGTAPVAAGGSVSETTDTDFNDGTFSNTAITGSGAAGSVVLAQAIDWATITSPTGQQINDVYMLSATDGWAVGNAGTILRWNGTAWSSVGSPDADNIMGVYAITASDAWASGANGRVWRWNGTAWLRYGDYGAQVWNDISCPDSTHCFIVGSSANNLIWRWTGSGAFTAMTDPGGNQTWYGISCTSATLCWTAGSSGIIGRMSGTTWSVIQDSGNNTLRSVHMLDANNGFVVGDSGNVRRCASTGCDVTGEWNVSDLGAQVFRSVSAVSASLAFAVGLTGIIYRWDGSTWTAETSPTGNDLYGVSAVSSNFAVAAGEAGTIVEYGLHYPTSGTRTYESSVLDAGATAAWLTLSWTETLPALTDLVIATRTGPTPAPDGSWSGWSATQTNPAGGAIVSPQNRYIQYRATLTTTNPFATPSLDSISMTYDASAPSLFAVSSVGTILGRNSIGWSQITDLGTHIFRGIDCISASDCWAVADSGRIAHWDGSAWSQFVDLGAQTFNAVKMVSGSEGWAVGSLGEIYRWNGTVWSSITSPTALSLNGIAMTSSTYGVAVGATGTIIEYDFHYYSSGTYISSTLDAGASVPWANAYWDQALPTGTTLSLYVQSSADGATWVPADPGLAVTTPGGTDISGLAAGRYLRYRAVLNTTDRYVASRLNSLTITYSSPLTLDYYDLYMINPTDGWAAGCAPAPGPYTTGSIAHWDGTGWSNWGAVPYCLDGIGGSASNDVWAVDFNGDAILHWNGTTWTPYDVTALTGTQYIYDVKCLNSSDCRASGTGGLMLRWNGTAWSAETSNTTQNIEWISYVAANDIWAAAAGGQIMHYNGTAWSVFVTYGTTTWHGVKMMSATDGWIVGGDAAGNNAQMRRWNGTTWNAVTLPGTPATYELQNIYCLNASYCWAPGGYQSVEGIILQWNGATWTIMLQNTPPATIRIKACWADTATHAWAVADNKNFLEYRTLYPTSGTWLSPPIDSTVAGTIWNGLYWDEIRPLTTDLTIATRSGPGPNCATTTWSSWSAELTDPGSSTLTSPPNRCFQYRATLTSGNQVYTAELEEVRVVFGALTDKALYGIQGTSDTDVHAVGENGTLAHYNGTDWSLQSSPYSSTWRDVDTVSSTDATVVGTWGRIANWDGTAWASVVSPTANELFAVDFRTASDGFAVGSGGTVIRCSGGPPCTWAVVASSTINDLNGVSMISASDGFAVGVNGTVIRWNGTAWNTVASGTTTTLNDVHCLDATHCWAVGEDGVIRFWNGTAWSGVTSPVGTRLHAVEWRSVTEAWAVGDFGTILRWDGANWTSTYSPTTRNLYDVSVFSPTDGWIVGAIGQLLKDPPPYMTDGTLLSSILDTDAGNAYWDTVFWTVDLPTNTTLTVATRSGGTATPDGTWSIWSAPEMSASGATIVSPAARYFQYRATLHTGDIMVTPSLQDITVTYHK